MPHRARVLLTTLLVCMALLHDADPAAAAWGVTGAGPARAQADVIPRAAMPTATKATPPPQYLPVYTLTWPTTKLSRGQGVIGYQVRRTVYPQTTIATTEPITNGTCAGTTVNGLTNVYVPANPDAPSQSCTDTDAYAKGEVFFTVTPVFARWVGPTSPASPIYS